MKRKLDMERIAKGLGAERRGKVSATGGYFGAMQLLADVEAKFRVPAGGGRPTDPRWTERRLVPLALETLERLEDITARVRKHGESTSNQCSSQRCYSRRQRGNSARRKPRSSSGRSGERVVELSGRPQASPAYRKRGACKALSSGGRRNRAGSAIPTPSRIQHSGMRSPAEYRSDLDGTHSPPRVSVTAEFDEIATGERTPGLLQAATRRETAEIDRREAETLDELFDECGRFGMVARDEDHATSSVLDRPFIEAGGDDRIERLDDAGTWRQGRHDLARALAAEIGEDELRTRLDEGIRRIDEHPAVPGGQALQR